MKWKVPYFDLRLGEEEQRAVASVIKSNWLTTGPKIHEFERVFAEQMKTSNVQAIAVCNCTAALHLALEALGVREGDEVICPSLTFVATVNAIRYTGATPIFADICSEEEWNISPSDIEANITDKTKAIMVVHYGGYPCRMGEILRISNKYNLKVIEDACHGPLAEWHGKKIGVIGDVGCFSFFSNKNMTTGEGGIVVTRNVELAENIRVMRSHGMSSTTYDRFKGSVFGYDVCRLGYNYRMDEIRAAIGIEQLKRLPGFNSQRKKLVEFYRKEIQTRIPFLSFPFKNWDGEYGYHIFPVLLPKGYTERNTLMVKLSEDGIQTSIHYRPVHSFTLYNNVNVKLPWTNSVANRILSLPLYPGLEKSQIHYVVSRLKLYV